MSPIEVWAGNAFWWIVEFFWFGLVFYGIPITLVAYVLARKKGYRAWLGKRKGFVGKLSKLPGANLKGYRTLRRATLFYLGTITLVSLFFFFQRYRIFEIGPNYLLRGLIGIGIIYGIFVENWSVRIPFRFFNTRPRYTLEMLKRMHHKDFEHLVAAIFKKQGFEVTVSGGSGDGGVDVLARRGNSRVVVSCKRYDGLVQPTHVRDLYGTMRHEEATSGYLVTSGYFARGSHQFIEGKPITLIDGVQLCKILNNTPRRI